MTPLRRVCLAILAFVVATPAAAQCPVDALECQPDSPRWVGEFASLSANALLGGLTAGIVRRMGGGEFAPAFVQGLLGGGAVYAGRRVAAERFDGAGLLGRQVAAVGASIVRNAGDAAPPLSHLRLPVGPVLVDLRAGSRPSLRIDPVALGWVVYGIAEAELRLDVSRTLSAGTPVFLTSNKLLSFGGDEPHAAGVTNAGVLFVADVPAYGDVVLERSLAHERIHTLQQDFFATAWTDPLAQALLARAELSRRLGAHVSVNLSTELMRGLGRLIPDHGDRPWEIEAIFFAR